MSVSDNNNRRSFLKKTLVASGGAFAANLFSSTDAKAFDNDTKGNNFIFLFQGDSITDGNRSRNNDWNHVMGHGYQYIIASELWYRFPQKQFHFYNRGISGNKVTDLAARWQTDTIDIKPDLLSILIGINDTEAFINGDQNFSAGAYTQQYKALLQQTKQQLPDVVLVLCEPFILPVGRVKDKYDVYKAEISSRQAIVQQLAIEFNAVYVPFQNAFDEALLKAPADYWIWDGIHPMPAGHELMAVEWKSAVRKKMKFIK